MYNPLVDEYASISWLWYFISCLILHTALLVHCMYKDYLYKLKQLCLLNWFRSKVLKQHPLCIFTSITVSQSVCRASSLSSRINIQAHRWMHGLRFSYFVHAAKIARLSVRSETKKVVSCDSVISKLPNPPALVFYSRAFTAWLGILFSIRIYLQCLLLGRWDV